MKLESSTSKQQVINRLKRLEGQIRGIQQMIEREDECMKIAEQLGACKAAISQTLNTFAVCAIEETDGGHKIDEIKRILQVVK